MILVEIGVDSPRVVHYNQVENEKGLRAGLDLVEELRNKVEIRVAVYQQRLSHYYNNRVNPKPLKEGDLVLRNTAISSPTSTRGNLTPNWEGPYKVKKILQSVTFKLETLGGREIPRSWNSEHLRNYYQ
ncbi:hypothetical protein CFOL_v3_11742 [Cephalotus follicularis]|uniref:Uncharacterized protein n=1 Tax=Cephalotus follicularis TaxID=3775 RepID=A0A1Q3BK22_CEPFO|nr:hypothetical protein CFOL_v3_11742 [Cephalotus follicularis]